MQNYGQHHPIGSRTLALTTRLFLLATLLLSGTALGEPRPRPDSWAHPIIGTGIKNLYQVDTGLYRYAQPEADDVDDIKALGITQVLNLRSYHTDSDEMKGSAIGLVRVPMHAGSVTEKQLLEALRAIQQRKGPILVHCWHGSDRTGATIAAYRIVFDHWSKAQALDEMVHGGFGYHRRTYPNLVGLINGLDVPRLREALR